MRDEPSRSAERERRSRLLWVLGVALATTGCLTSQGVGPNADRPLDTVAYVDLERFAGRWYVIENIGLAPEADAYDEVETYTLLEDGTIDIAFTFREGAFDGPARSIPQQGWVHDETTNAEWRVRPFWPLSLAYLILDLDETNYRWTVVGHPSKRWVWIMAREPVLEETTLGAIRERLVASGYDLTNLRRVPQRPLSERSD